MTELCEAMDRVLIANRGEIAVRIINTCRKMGITTIAVYSEADRGARHVALADEAHCIGAPAASASYLDAEKIIGLAQRVDARAIHPGYGFLSENAGFAEQCAAAGLVFIGPPGEVIAQMGSKIESKRIARACGIPTVPGYAGERQEAAVLRVEAEKIGVPVLIKASAGGGGRGMRVVTDLARFDALLAQSVKEAESAFGDGRVLLEKYIATPRHLEVQVLADHHGNLLHLFERECSIQRNHQKVIEEAPAAFLDSEQRNFLHESALTICRHIGYHSAGTVEFLVDSDTGAAYFLEMNTRLQVEHPVTELITGIDLVEWQIRIAAGEELPFRQHDLVPSGWAIEARVVAENPADDYRPEVGRLALYREPEAQGLRVDSGISQGAEVTPYYDALIAKVIAHGDTREQARDRLREGLGDFLLGGVGNNVAFLRDLLSCPAFLSQPLTTHYIEQQFPEGWRAVDEPEERLLVAALLAWNLASDAARELQQTPWGQLGGWRLLRNAGHRARHSVVLKDVSGRAHSLEYIHHAEGWLVTFDERTIACAEARLDNAKIELEIGGERLRYWVKIEGRQVLLTRGARSHAFDVLPQREALAGDSPGELTGEGFIRSPMPGAIDAIRVGVGDRIVRGDVLVIMEAMKLVHSLCAGVDGRIAAIHCREGQSVEANALLVEVETDES